jgi:hypothetical protein
MRGGKAFAAWGLAWTLALAGCSKDEEAGGPTPSGPPADTTTASSTASSSTPPPHDGPPTLPALARQHSNAGAKAFVRYYIDVLNYAFAHDAPQRLAHLGSASCDFCQSFISVLTRVIRAGGSQIGGDFVIEREFLAAVDEQGTRVVIADVRVQPGVSRATATSPPHQIRRDRYTLEFHATWVKGSHWSVREMRIA